MMMDFIRSQKIETLIYYLTFRSAKTLLSLCLIIALSGCFISEGTSPVINEDNAVYPFIVGSQVAILTDGNDLERTLRDMGLAEYVPDNIERIIENNSPFIEGYLGTLQRHGHCYSVSTDEQTTYYMLENLKDSFYLLSQGSTCESTFIDNSKKTQTYVIYLENGLIYFPNFDPAQLKRWLKTKNYLSKWWYDIKVTRKEGDNMDYFSSTKGMKQYFFEEMYKNARVKKPVFSIGGKFGRDNLIHIDDVVKAAKKHKEKTVSNNQKDIENRQENNNYTHSDKDNVKKNADDYILRKSICEDFSFMSSQGMAYIGVKSSLNLWAGSVSTFYKKYNSSELRSDIDKAVEMKKIADEGLRVIDEIKNAKHKTINPSVKDTYDVLSDGMLQYSELYLVGSKLLEARASRDTSVLLGLGKALISEEAKHFASPVLDAIELEMRINEFQKTAPDRQKSIQSRLRAAWKRLPRGDTMPCD